MNVITHICILDIVQDGSYYNHQLMTRVTAATKRAGILYVL